MHYEQLKRRQKQLEEKIKVLERELKKFPDGNLVCVHDKGRYKWYESIGGKKKYISKKEQGKVETLAKKKLLLLEKNDLQLEQHAIQAYHTIHKDSSKQTENFLMKNPDYQELFSATFLPLSKKATEWMQEPYQSNTKYSEGLSYRTISGRFVRSKSEVMIDMCLSNHGLPFRYECALELGEVTFFPDFTILHPRTGKLFYWEHFGKMDDFIYCKNTFSKLQIYAQHGIIPTINLITTYETKERPLSLDVIEKNIEDYLL